ncbi:NAD(P)/FAD-dependent oxidoreductase [Actinokineospora guangxiensis]|uniref:NAD(P)/FAD-dependent oxidoreductase n=1 Tax=Actinokineospora guangxiensis TaxID=1490288 RepID=A0ABW0ESN0_9PSEU
MTRQQYNAVIIGGGAAGLSAAVALGRARRSVLVVDAGEPRNAPASHMHGFLSRDGMNPAELLRVGRLEAEGYGVEVHRGHALSVSPGSPGCTGFTVELAERPPVRARRVLLATGLRDDLPDIPGLAERWGKDALHCPYCHGWEVRDERIAVIGTSHMAAHHALLWRQWTPNLTFIAHSATPDAEQSAQLAARGISVVHAQVAGLDVRGDRLTGLHLHNGATLPFDAVTVGARFHPVLPRIDGLAPVDHMSGMGTHVPVDAMGRTAVPGIWAAGNLANPMANVIAAAAEGSLAAHMLNMDLITEDTDLAVRAAS